MHIYFSREFDYIFEGELYLILYIYGKSNNKG